MTSSRWIDGLSDDELAQIKLIYAAIYAALGIGSRYPKIGRCSPEKGSLNSYTDSSSEVFYDESGMTSSGASAEVVMAPKNQPLDVYKKIPNGKRFPPVEQLTGLARKHFQSHDKEKLLAKFRWLTRDNSDKMIARYVRQHGSSFRAVSALSRTIIFHLDRFNVEDILEKGEKYYIDNDPDASFLTQLKGGQRVITGLDNLGRPVNVFSANAYSSERNRAAEQRYSVLMLDHTFRVLQDGCDGATFVYDLTGMQFDNRHYAAAKFIISNANTIYPCLVGRTVFHNASKMFRAMWKMLGPLVNPNMSGRAIIFTNTLPELLKYVSIDQLPASVGGCTKHDYHWIEPNPEIDDAPMRNLEERERLKQERKALMEQLESLTRSWIKEADFVKSKKLLERRKLILELCEKNYWTLDPYVRSRAIFDRNGVFGRLKPELAKGGLAQPCCEISESDQDLNEPQTPDLGPVRGKPGPVPVHRTHIATFAMAS